MAKVVAKGFALALPFAAGFLGPTTAASGVGAKSVLDGISGAEVGRRKDDVVGAWDFQGSAWCPC